MSAIAIITARGGSKRIPRKNIKNFCGKPILQYSIEAALGSEMFDDMIEDIRTDVVKILLNIRKKEGQVQRTQTTQITGAGLEDTAINLVDGNISEKEGGMNKTVVNEEPKIGRNDPCPCGSGKKYKNCCWKNA